MEKTGSFVWLQGYQHRYRYLGLSLLGLHASVVFAEQPALRAALILVHFGFFLLWQPLWHTETKIQARNTPPLLVAIAAVIFLPSLLPLAIWLLIVIGLLGGEYAPGQRDRLAQLFAISYAFLELLLGVTPELFQITNIEPVLQQAVNILMLIPPILLTLIKASEPDEDRMRIDYIRSLSVLLFALMLFAGSVLWMYRSGIGYSEALFQTLLTITTFIIAINWLWKTQNNHSFFQLLWNRYLLNLGSPLENYLLKLSSREIYNRPADEYLEAALRELADLDWVTGVAWTTNETSERVIGNRTNNLTPANGKELSVTVYTDDEVSPTFVLHIQLLVRLTEQFYTARKQEHQLKKHSHLQAIYETGSRLTHDIKNLLQSLQSVAAVVQSSEPDQAANAMVLLKRQLPEINKRLQLTLEKLKRPNVERDSAHPADKWWESLKGRYHERNIIFDENLLTSTPIPNELFDNVADNLLENAHYKQSLDKSVEIRVSLTIIGGRIILLVCDTGEPVPLKVERELFIENVTSSRGLGIGLYHCNQLANRYGYKLELQTNDAGNVCFSLSGKA